MNAENFIRIGISGEGEPVMLPGIMDSLLEDSLETSDKSGSITIIDGWADADIAITLLLIGKPWGKPLDCLCEIAKIFKQMENR